MIVRILNEGQWRLSDGRVVTQDTVVEGVHFSFAATSWRNLGYKAAAVNLSDLAAMGAEPEGLVVTIAVQTETESAAATRSQPRIGNRARRAFSRSGMWSRSEL